MSTNIFFKVKETELKNDSEALISLKNNLLFLLKLDEKLWENNTFKVMFQKVYGSSFDSRKYKDILNNLSFEDIDSIEKNGKVKDLKEFLQDIRNYKFNTQDLGADFLLEIKRIFKEFFNNTSPDIKFLSPFKDINMIKMCALIQQFFDDKVSFINDGVLIKGVKSVDLILNLKNICNAFIQTKKITKKIGNKLIITIDNREIESDMVFEILEKTMNNLEPENRKNIKDLLNHHLNKTSDVSYQNLEFLKYKENFQKIAENELGYHSGHLITVIFGGTLVIIFSVGSIIKIRRTQNLLSF